MAGLSDENDRLSERLDTQSAAIQTSVERQGELMRLNSEAQTERMTALYATSVDTLMRGQRAISQQLTESAAATLQAVSVVSANVQATRNDVVAMSRSGIARRINRRRFDLAELRHRLARSSSIERRVLDGLRTHVEARRSSIAFHPVGACSVDEPVSGVVRIRREHSGEQASCIVNLGRHEIEVDDDFLPPLGVVWNV